MQKTLKILIGAIIGFALLAGAQAGATSRPTYCEDDHDHRSHDANYYDYYDADSYYRAGPYRASARYDRDLRYDDRRSYRGRRNYDDRRGYRGRGYGYDRYPRSEVVFKRNIDLRGHRGTYVTVVEENYWTRSGRVQRVCSIVPKGYDAYNIPHRRLSQIARNNCSRHARIQYL